MPSSSTALPTISAIVPAAGCGARAGLGANKVLCVVRARPLLWWTLRALLEGLRDQSATGARCVELLVPARRDECAAIESVFSALPTEIPLRAVEGGASRQQSVWNAARVANGDWLLVHDAARPLLSPELTARVCQSALSHGAAIAALPVSDTLKIARAIEPNGVAVIESTLDRRLAWLAQTPQVFRRKVLCAAFAQAARAGFEGTDCASIVERWEIHNGETRPEIALVEGQARNFKVTFAADLERAATLLSNGGE